ncbi:MAG: hypothetical protein O9327_03640 [Polaromonas sp.]|nr:hypothetical protein [Polaromonas sp.]
MMVSRKPTPTSASPSTVHLVVPARYWDDYSDRQAVDEPSQMATEIKRAGTRVTISVDLVQLKYLKSDAEFYAGGNTDDTPASIVRGAKRVLALCNEIKFTSA